MVCPPAAVLGECTCNEAWFDPTGITVICENKGLNKGSVDEVLQALLEPFISTTITFAASKNNLTKVPADLSKLSEHAYIYLEDNQITSIPSGAFKSILGFVSIDLRKNLISSIEPGAFNYPNALYSKLNLSYNKLTTIPAGVFEGNVETILCTKKVMMQKKNKKIIKRIPCVFYLGTGNSFTYLFLSHNLLTRFEEGIFKPILEKIVAEDIYSDGKPGIYIANSMSLLTLIFSYICYT